MRSWRKEALRVISEAREHATVTANIRLHLACCRTIEVLVAEGCQVPSDLRLYAKGIRELFGTPDNPTSGAEPAGARA
jgi:hypothetical protein